MQRCPHSLSCCNRIRCAIHMSGRAGMKPAFPNRPMSATPPAIKIQLVASWPQLGFIIYTAYHARAVNPFRAASGYRHGAGPLLVVELSESATISNLIILLVASATTKPRHGKTIASTECSANAINAAPHGMAFIAYIFHITPRTRRSRAPQTGHMNDTVPGIMRPRCSTLITSEGSLRDAQDAHITYA